MKKEDIPLLGQIIDAVEEAELDLERYYEEKNHEKFNKSRKFILYMHNKIYEILK